MPVGNVYDSGDYPAVLDKALEMAGWDDLLRMQEAARAQGRYVGIGLATAQQRSAYGPTEFWFWDDSSGATRSVPESVGLGVGPDRRVRGHAVLALLGQQPRDGVRPGAGRAVRDRPRTRSPSPTRLAAGLPGAGPGGSRMTVMLTGPRWARRAS